MKTKTFNPEWRTSTVVGLARSMYENRDFGPMPILSDALQDAGCEDEEIIDHCRSDIVHCPTCPVLVKILGKKIVPRGTFTYVVDYDINPQASIEAGNYKESRDANHMLGGFLPDVEYFNSKYFPPTDHESGKKEQLFRIFSFGQEVFTPQIRPVLNLRGFQPATLREFLAFYSFHPKPEDNVSIVALDATINRRIIHADEDDYGDPDEYAAYIQYECLGLCPSRHNVDWDTNFRFLAIQKTS